MRTRVLFAGFVVALIAAVAAIARSSRPSAMSAAGDEPRTQPSTSTRALSPTATPLPSAAEVARAAPVARAAGAIISSVRQPTLGDKVPARNLNDKHSSALHDAIVGATPGSARLYVAFARAGMPTPPEARILVQMKQAGAPPQDLIEYVKTSFPHDLLVRAVALRWLGVGAGAGTHLVPSDTAMHVDNVSPTGLARGSGHSYR